MKVKSLALLKIAHHLAHVEEMCRFLAEQLREVEAEASGATVLAEDIIEDLEGLSEAAGAASREVMGDAV